jgi:hypothetical protein
MVPLSIMDRFVVQMPERAKNKLSLMLTLVLTWY